MLTFLTIVHILIGIGLMLFVLLQDPKGGAMGVFSGGSSSNSFFGSSGASNLLTSATKWCAILFAGSCLVLTYLTASKKESVMDNFVSPPAQEAPTQVTPAQDEKPAESTPPSP